MICFLNAHCTVMHTNLLNGMLRCNNRSSKLRKHALETSLCGFIRNCLERWYIPILQVGDGTTTVVLLAGEFLREAKPFIEEGVHPQLIIRSFRTAAHLVRPLWDSVLENTTTIYCSQHHMHLAISSSRSIAATCELLDCDSEIILGRNLFLIYPV